MKRMKKVWLMGLVLAVGLGMTGCAQAGEKLDLPKKVSYGVFIKNPAPPVCKEIVDDEELASLVSILKEAKATKVEDAGEKDRLSAQGWSAWLRLVDKEDKKHDTLDEAWSIAIYGEDVLNVQKTFYQVPESVVEELLEQYEDLGGKEQDYSDYLAQETEP